MTIISKRFKNTGSIKRINGIIIVCKETIFFSWILKEIELKKITINKNKEFSKPSLE